ncbi:SNF2-related protein [Lasiodiplodia theobromae]|uniref:Transcription termination factor 2 n=1 Tax=Lasiodiplodia theobromae TaxID=45133 RepID=A0A5N5D839_9PEZI|nr:Transcription termination factor 2 [Lasiodiplodia theobromae]KAF9639879.1 SNF2-related protein [Lasiodiplodia theobromae]
MSETQVKAEPEDQAFIQPPRPTDPGATRETAIEIDDIETPVKTEEEDDDDVGLPPSNLRDFGHDKASAILIDDGDTPDTHQGEHSLSPATPNAPLTSTVRSESPVAPGNRQSPPLRLGTSMLSTPGRKPARRDLQQMRLLRKRLRSSVNNNNNDDYGPIYGAPPTPGPSHNGIPGPSVATPEEQQQHSAPVLTPFEQARAEYEGKKANGISTIEDDITFLRLQNEEDARKKQEAADALYEAEGDMDVDEDFGAPQDDPEEDSLFVPRSTSRRRKRTGAWPGRDDDDEDDFLDVGEGPSSVSADRDEGDSSEEVEGKRKRRKKSKSTTRKRAKKGEGSRRGKKNARAQSPQAEASTNGARALDSLMHSNVFRDAAANQNAPDLPEITATRKTEALKKLIASVPQSQRKKALTDKNELFKASQKFSRRGARPNGAGGWKITGMVSSLQNHQLIGAGFMREREGAADKPHGGLCADAMGLGKTLEMIANIINDRPRKPEPGEPITTLIVLPATLVTQWHDELKKHVDRRQRLSILEWKAGSRPETHDPVETISKFDIVLTTYYEVRNSYPKAEVPIELQTSEEKNAWWKEYFEQHKGHLHSVQWRRVVLDEAQAIKNYRSATSLACRALKSRYRWALSGTPILNSALELYPYFKFLQVPYTGTFRVFKANYYSKADDEPMERLSIMVNRFMIRRTHKDTMFGAPIVKLPKASDRIHWVKFNDLERAIYEIVRKRMVTRVNSFAQDNTLQRNYRNVLVMLLRLRQMTGNLLLVEVVMKDLLEREDHEKIRKLAEMELDGDDTRRAQIIELRRMLSKPPPDAQVDENDDNYGFLDDVPDEGISLGRAHGKKFNFNRYLQDLREGKEWEDLKKRTLCVVCNMPPDQPYVTSCYHIYCEECLEMQQHESAAKGEPHALCLQCSVEYIWSHPCDEFDLDSIVSDIDEADINADDEPPVERWRKKKSKKSKGKDRNDEESVTRTWIEKNGTVLPSAKTIAVKAQILNWLQQDPEAKILVYTQFISMIQIMKKICQMEEWNFLEYTGKMSIAARDKALDSFKNGNASILLASLKCGGLGLNLTAAKHVISIDPWWNSAIEQQAFCRVFRIGQTEETSMTRFAVANSIDEKLIAMQDKKQKEIDRVMGDSGPQRENLSVSEMMRLFGPVREDNQGREFIIVEDKETLPQYDADSEDEGDED